VRRWMRDRRPRAQWQGRWRSGSQPASVYRDGIVKRVSVHPDCGLLNGALPHLEPQVTTKRAGSQPPRSECRKYDPACPAPRGAGASQHRNLEGRLKYGNAVPALGGRVVPGVRVPRPRPTPVQAGYNSGRPPHAGCCSHTDAGCRLSTSNTGASSSDPCSGGVTDAARTADHSARSAYIPFSVMARAVAAEAAPTGGGTDAAVRARRGSRSSLSATREVLPLGFAWSLSPGRYLWL